MQQNIIFKETVSILPGGMQSTQYIKNNGRTVIVDEQTAIGQDEELPIVLESGTNIEMLVKEDKHIVINGKAPANLSDLNDDETHRTVTDEEKTKWNAKSDFSGSWNDLTDKPIVNKEILLWEADTVLNGTSVSSGNTIGYMVDGNSRNIYVDENACLIIDINGTEIILPYDELAQEDGKVNTVYRVIGQYDGADVKIAFPRSTTNKLYNLVLYFTAEYTDLNVHWTYKQVYPMFDERYIPDTIARKSDIPTAIIDVDALPTENINANAFYRVKGGYYCLINNIDGNEVVPNVNVLDNLPATIHTVGSLPETGDVYIDSLDTPSRSVVYLLTSDLKVYAYFDETLSNALGLSIGWVELGTTGMPYSVVNSVDEATETGNYYFIPTEGGLFAYNGTEWVEYVTKAQLDEAVANAGGGKLYRHTILIQFDASNVVVSLGCVIYSYSAEAISKTTVTEKSRAALMNSLAASGKGMVVNEQNEIALFMPAQIKYSDTNEFTIVGVGISTSVIEQNSFSVADSVFYDGITDLVSEV